jgi:hypothetical protein
MKSYITHILCGGTVRRIALVSMDVPDARREALLLGRSLFRGRAFSFTVMEAV